MASPYEVEVKLSSANNLKNVNWRNGPNRPYAVVWVDPTQKRSTTVDKFSDTQANWDEKLVIPLPPATTVDDSILFIDILHSPLEQDVKPVLIGSARLPLVEAQSDVAFGSSRTLKLKRPSGRPQGTVDVKVVIRNTSYRAPNAYDAPPYGVPPPAQQTYENSYNIAPPNAAYAAATPALTPYGSSYGAAPPTTAYAEPTPTPYGSSYNAIPYGSSYNVAPPTTVYTAAAPTPAPYGQAGYGYGQAGQLGYGYGQGGQTVNVGGGAMDDKKSMFGMGTGLVMGAVVGGIGALVLEKGIDKAEDKIADRVAKKVEEDDDEYYYDDDY